MKPYVIEPSEWWNDCGVWRYDDETFEFSITVLEDEKRGTIKFGGYSLTYSGNSDFYLDPTQEEQRFTSWGYILRSFDASKFFNEDDEPGVPLTVSDSFIKAMEAYSDQDSAAYWAASEFAQWAQESGGVPITTDTDAHEPVSKWLDGWEHNDGIEPLAVIHFLFEYGFDTDAAA